MTCIVGYSDGLGGVIIVGDSAGILESFTIMRLPEIA